MALRRRTSRFLANLASERLSEPLHSRFAVVFPELHLGCGVFGAACRLRGHCHHLLVTESENGARRIGLVVEADLERRLLLTLAGVADCLGRDELA